MASRKQQHWNAYVKQRYEQFGEYEDEYGALQYAQGARFQNLHKDRLTPAQVEKAYELARRAGAKNNIARTIVSQERYFWGKNLLVKKETTQGEVWDHPTVKTANFAKRYEDYYGESTEQVDFSDKAERHAAFAKFIEDREAEGMSHAAAQSAAEDYFYSL